MIVRHFDMPMEPHTLRFISVWWADAFKWNHLSQKLISARFNNNLFLVFSRLFSKCDAKTSAHISCDAFSVCWIFFPIVLIDWLVVICCYATHFLNVSLIISYNFYLFFCLLFFLPIFFFHSQCLKGKLFHLEISQFLVNKVSSSFFGLNFSISFDEKHLPQFQLGDRLNKTFTICLRVVWKKKYEKNTKSV